MNPLLWINLSILGFRALSSVPLMKIRRNLPLADARSNSRSVGEMPSASSDPYSFPKRPTYTSQSLTSSKYTLSALRSLAERSSNRNTSKYRRSSASPSRNSFMVRRSCCSSFWTLLRKRYLRLAIVSFIIDSS